MVIIFHFLHFFDLLFNFLKSFFLISTSGRVYVDCPLFLPMLLVVEIKKSASQVVSFRSACATSV